MKQKKIRDFRLEISDFPEYDYIPVNLNKPGRK